MKNKINIIYGIVTILSVLFGMWTNYQSTKIKTDNERLTNNLYKKTIEYEDELGRRVTETTQMELTIKEMKQAAKKDSTQLNEYEKLLVHTYSELSASNRKMKQVESAMNIELHTRNTIETTMKDSVIDEMEVKTAYVENEFGKYSIMYEPETDSLFLTTIQKNQLFVDVFKKRKPNKNGKEAIYLLRWTKGWDYKASIKSLNDSTIIKEFDYIKIKKS